MNVQLAPVGVALSEVVVKPKKEKYSKKNNPAVIFLNRIRAALGKNDPTPSAMTFIITKSTSA